MSHLVIIVDNGNFRFPFAPYAKARINAILERYPWTREWSPVEFIVDQLSNNGSDIEISQINFDALFGLWQILHACDELTIDDFLRLTSVVFIKLKVKVGAKSNNSFVQDVLYEGHIRLLFAYYDVPWIEFSANEQAQPDLSFACKFFLDGGPSIIDIECKNIRREQPTIRNLVRKSVSCIRSARGQFLRRRRDARELCSLLIFVDLPLAILAFEKESYYQFIVNIWHQLKAEGISDINESNIIFTATSQDNMSQCLNSLGVRNGGMTMFYPLVSGKESVQVNAAMAILLSWIFREKDQNINIYNWSKNVTTIKHPEEYLF